MFHDEGTRDEHAAGNVVSGVPVTGKPIITSTLCASPMTKGGFLSNPFVRSGIVNSQTRMSAHTRAGLQLVYSHTGRSMA